MIGTRSARTLNNEKRCCFRFGYGTCGGRRLDRRLRRCWSWCGVVVMGGHKHRSTRIQPFLPAACCVVMSSVGQRNDDSSSGCSSRSLLRTASLSVLEFTALLGLVWFSYVVQPAVPPAASLVSCVSSRLLHCGLRMFDFSPVFDVDASTVSPVDGAGTVPVWAAEGRSLW